MLAFGERGGKNSKLIRGLPRAVLALVVTGWRFGRTRQQLFDPRLWVQDFLLEIDASREKHDAGTL